MPGNYAVQAQAGGLGGQASTQVKASRINMDVERVLALSRTANSARDRVSRYSSALGYFSDAPADRGDGAEVQPISNNMQSALNDLERSLENLNSALNLFD